MILWKPLFDSTARQPERLDCDPENKNKKSREGPRLAAVWELPTKKGRLFVNSTTSPIEAPVTDVS
jgi:hypothetical protein